MIERFIKNDLTLKRWRRFKKRKAAVVSSVAFLLALLATFTAPLISNSKPIFMKYKGEYYFPAVKSYHPKEFGITDILVMNYKELEFKGEDFAVWPPFKWGPYESNRDVYSYPAPPSNVNPLGTDDRGRDVFARLLYGFKYSITYAALVTIISYLVGIILGGIMGYFGAKIDFFGQRIVEIMSTVPQFFLIIILISIFSPSMTLLVVVTSLFYWIPISYYVRAEFLKNRKRDFVEAAISMGAPTKSILFKHILPNSLSPIITFAPFAIAYNIIGLASLDYLGFGLKVPTPSWGELLSQAKQYYTIAWWLALYPSLALFTSLTLLNLMGEGVRDAMDPNLS